MTNPKAIIVRLRCRALRVNQAGAIGKGRETAQAISILKKSYYELLGSHTTIPLDVRQEVNSVYTYFTGYTAL